MSQVHWDSVYATEHLDELGWYEPMPSTLGLVTAYSTPDDSVIDVGGGLSPEGPDKGAGLEVCRYDVAALAGEFAPEFRLVEGRRLIPIAGTGDQRPYIGVALRRIGRG